MEPPIKRPRLGHAPYESDDDEICMEPAEFTAKQDPGYRLDRSRAVAAFKLKSTFEHIFEKYDKDFSDIGDEIDLATGEIVVDNGHLRSMEVGQDVGGHPLRTGAEGEGDDTASSEDEERILHGGRMQQPSPPRSTTLVRRVPLQPEKRPPVGAWSNTSSLLGGASRLSGLFSPQAQFGASLFSFGSFGSSNDFVDPAWRAPPLPMPSFSDTFRSSLGSGYARPVPRRVVVRKALPMPAGAENDDEDDVLFGPTPTQPPVPPQQSADHAGSNIRAVSRNTGTTPHKNKDERSPRPSRPPGPRQQDGSAEPTGRASAAESRRKALTTSLGPQTSQDRALEGTGSGRSKKPLSKQRAKRVFDPEVDVDVPRNMPAHPRSKSRTTLRQASDKQIAQSRSRRKSKGVTVQKPAPDSKAYDRSSRADKMVGVPESGSSHGSRGIKQAASAHPRAEIVDSSPVARTRSRKEKSSARTNPRVRKSGTRSVTQVQTPADSSFDALPRDEQFTSVTKVPELLLKERMVIEIVERRPSPEPEINRQPATTIATMTPETTEEEADEPIPRTLNHEHGTGKPSAEAFAVAQNPVHIPTPSQNSRDVLTQKESPKKPVETFSWNEVDPSYTFSDEDEALITRIPSTRHTKTETKQTRRQGPLPSPAHEEIHSLADVARATVGDVEGHKSPSSPTTNPSTLEAAAHTPETGPSPRLDFDAPDPLSGRKKRTIIRYTKRNRQRSKTTPSPAAPRTAQSAVSPLADKSAVVASLPAEDPTLSPPNATVRTPKTPSAVPPNIPPPLHNSLSRDGLAALVSDSDEDELSLTPQPASRHTTTTVTTTLHSSGATRKSTLKRGLLVNAHATSSPHTPVKPAARGAGARRSGGVGSGSGRVAGTRFVLAHRAARQAPSPTEDSLVRTPGGTVRRCGEDGFRCDRDFCFSCL